MYNILICDDQPDIVNALKIYLKPEGYQLFTARNGKEAVDVDDIDDAPSIDAVLVVHGKWIPMYNVDWIYGKKWLTDYICTECGQLHKKKSNYCPNCGAKMDKEN